MKNAEYSFNVKSRGQRLRFQRLRGVTPKGMTEEERTYWRSLRYKRI